MSRTLKRATLSPLRVPRVTTTRLPNGVRLVVVPVAHTTRVHVTAQLRGGPVHEDDSTWGYSHLVEHMVFRGTRRHQDVRAVSLAADDFGGEVNAATWHERVAFDTRCDPDRVEDAFDLLAAMLGAPRFMGLNVEREVVLEEIAELFDDDGQEVDADNLAFRRVFAGHGLSRSIEGTPEHLEHATLKSLRAFHKRNYGSENLVVSVAGPVDPAAALRAARRTFGKLPTSPPPPPGTPPAPPARKKAVEVVRTDALQTSVRLCFPTSAPRTTTPPPTPSWAASSTTALPPASKPASSTRKASPTPCGAPPTSSPSAASWSSAPASATTRSARW
jgi:predicted Zn-dependent peptidase